MKKKKKILFAAVDIGFRIELYTQFIKKHYGDQLDPKSLSIYILPKEQYQTKYDYEYHLHNRGALYRWYRALMNYFMCLFKFDIFHFISGETMLPRKLRRFELWSYRLLGKRIVMQFVGSDIRNPDYIEWKEKNIQAYLAGKDDFPKTQPWQKKLIRDAVKYSHAILVSTPDLKELIPQAVYYPVMLNMDKFNHELSQAHPEPKKEKEIIILHAPSNIKLKGTPIIHETLRKLALESKHRIKLVLPAQQKTENGLTYSVSRYELFKLYREADIIIDQLIIGWYGLQAVEGMAAGKKVICYVDQHLHSQLYPACPLYLANAITLREVVENCISESLQQPKPVNPDTIAWVKKYHTIENNHDELIKAWGIS